MNPVFPCSVNKTVNTKDVFKNQPIQISKWFNKKIYLGYSKKTGWKIRELGLFDRFLRKLNLAYRDTHFSHVCKNLENLTNKEALFLSSSDLMKKMPELKKRLKKICQKRGINKQAYQSQPIFTPKPKLNKILVPPSIGKESMENVSVATPEIAQDIENFKPPSATTPLFLSNYQASRCYLDSVLEMTLSQDSMRKKIFEAYKQNGIKLKSKTISDKDKEDLKKERKILEKLLNLILIVAKTKGKGKGDLSPIGKNSAAEQIRESIFASELNSDLSDLKKIYNQQDAAAALLLINDLVGNTFETVEVDRAIGADIVSPRPVAKGHKLELRLEEGRENDLNALINRVFAPQTVENPENYKKFNLEDGTLCKLPYTTQTQLKDLSETLTLHVARYTYNLDTGSGKLNEPVALPANGIVDLTPYYFGKEAGPHQYEITGYVVHHGHDLNHGHYTANIKIGHKYYECDDGNSNFHREITAQEFYGNKNAYLVMLKRIPAPLPI